MTVGDFVQAVIGRLGYQPNGQQRMVIEALARFCSPTRARLADSRASHDRVFILNGYAGTGKTSLSGALVGALAEVGVESVLMAPTGRAAKVFSAFAGRPAYTIHRRIYRHALGASAPGLQDNKYRNAIFVVDEASMIGDRDDSSGGSLLQDLLQYVYSGEGCRMILLGDTAQLPPVGDLFSPAMDVATLRGMGLSVSSATMTAIARQGACSGILANATALRRAMRMEPMPEPRIVADGYDDVRFVDSTELPDIIDTCYRSDGIDATILVTRSNRRAADFNAAIRATVLYMDDEICRGELLLVAKNNYYWSRGVKGLDFIANGDTLVVEKVYGTETRYGLRWADLRLSLSDNAEVAFDAKILLDTLASDAPAMAPGTAERLYGALMEELGPAGADPIARARFLRDNAYWNALQTKYGYAVTCHKAQGGQWLNVFVDMDYVPPEAMGIEFYRWLYTAVTRARLRLFVIGGAPQDR